MIFLITVYIKRLKKDDKIDDLKKVPKFLHKMLINITKRTNNFYTNTIDEDKKIYLIIDENNKNIYKNIIKKLKDEKTKTQKVQIVLEDDLKEYIDYFSEFKILNGKDFMNNNVKTILEKILENIPMALQDVFILTNKYNEQSIRTIKNIGQEFKSVNVISKEIEKYKTLEDILENETIVFSIANNKKKSLKKAKIIINMDFSNEQLQEYNICRSAIIVNLSKEKIKDLKSFEGIIVQNVEIELEDSEKKFFKENNIIEEFKKVELYESISTKKIQDVKRIKKIYGNNGEIDKKELINIRKILTNIKN